MDDMRKCIGSTKFGIEAHEAPLGDFPIQPSQKDGLGRMCKPHWTEYTRALRTASLASQAEGKETIDGAIAAYRSTIPAEGEQIVAAVDAAIERLKVREAAARPKRTKPAQKPEPIRTKPARTPKHESAPVPEAGAQGDAG
jgi:hypothetical protein